MLLIQFNFSVLNAIQLIGDEILAFGEWSSTNWKAYSFSANQVRLK